MLVKCKYRDFYTNIYYEQLSARPFNAHPVFDTLVYVKEVACIDAEDMDPYLMEKEHLLPINNIELYLYY